MPKCYQYLIARPIDARSEIEGLEAKGNALGLGPLDTRREILRPSQRRRRFRNRREGFKLYTSMNAGDTIVFPCLARAFQPGDFASNLRRWIAGGVRVIVIDLGLDTADEFGQRMTATILKLFARSGVLDQNRERKQPAAGSRRILGLVTRGARGRRYLQVDPVMYEIGLKCQGWVEAGWTYDQIETHLWKERILRQLRHEKKVIPIDIPVGQTLAQKWTASALRLLVRNISKIDAGVLSGEFRLPTTWRPSAGPLAEIPRIQPGRSHRAPGEHWDKAEAIGRKVRELRRAKEWSQTRLARECEMTQSMIAELELGHHHPKSSTLGKVAVALGVPMSTFNLQPAVPV